jgi:hypothetical protein
MRSLSFKECGLSSALHMFYVNVHIGCLWKVCMILEIRFTFQLQYLSEMVGQSLQEYYQSLEIIVKYEEKIF